MNTEVEYLYRDGANYKLWITEVLPGELSEAEIAEIFEISKDQMFEDLHPFYPENIALDAKTFASEGHKEYDDDPDWHELISITRTRQTPTTKFTADLFLESFRNRTAIQPKF